jgi:hypothetical protein
VTKNLAINGLQRVKVRFLMASKISNVLSAVAKYICGLFVVIVHVPLILLISPLLLFRRIIFHLAPIIKPNLAKMVTAQSTGLAWGGSVYSSAKAKLIIGIVVEGRPTRDKLREGLENAFAGMDKNGKPLYPELSQKVTHWMGYLFWEPISKSDSRLQYEETESMGLFTYIENEKGDVNVSKLMYKESLLPFPEGSPLWKLTLISNYKDDIEFEDETIKNSFLILSFHHTLVDGFSIMKLAQHICKLSYEQPTSSKESIPMPGIGR